MKQFIMFDQKLKDNHDLDSDGKLAYAYLYDRMRSSVKRPDFYDEGFNDYYVIYTIEEMMADLNVSRGKVIEIYKKLVQIGLLIKKRQFSKATKLFLPEFKKENCLSSKSEPSEVQKSNSNHTNLNHNNKLINTVNTKKDKNSNEYEKLRRAVIGKSKMSPLALDAIFQYTGSKFDEARKLIGIIYKAKRAVAIQNNLLNSKISKFENNANLINRFSFQLKHILTYAKLVKNPFGYIYKSLTVYFKEAFGLIKNEIVTPETTFKSHFKKMYEPEWLNKEYVPKDKPVSNEEIARMKNRLKQLRN